MRWKEGRKSVGASTLTVSECDARRIRRDKNVLNHQVFESIVFFVYTLEMTHVSALLCMNQIVLQSVWYALPLYHAMLALRIRKIWIMDNSEGFSFPVANVLLHGHTWRTVSLLEIPRIEESNPRKRSIFDSLRGKIDKYMCILNQAT